MSSESPVEFEEGDDAEIEIDSDALCYPAVASLEEQRRAFVLDCIGGAASELAMQSLCEMVLDLAEMLESGKMPPKRRGNLRAVSGKEPAS